MCETGHSNLTFTTVKQKIAWEYLLVYLRYSNFALNSLFKHFEHFPGIEIFEKIKFTAKHCEYV